MGTGTLNLKQQSSRATRRRRTAVCLSLTLAGASLGLLSLKASPPALVWNHTASVPVGLYSIAHAPPVKGDIVVISPSGRLRATLENYGALPANRLLLKELAAASGKTVCRHQAVITIDGVPSATAKAATSDGRVLPSWSGCRKLGADDVLVLTPHAGSFDGRYFGPIGADQIVGVARPIITLSQEEAR